MGKRNARYSNLSRDFKRNLLKINQVNISLSGQEKETMMQTRSKICTPQLSEQPIQARINQMARVKSEQEGNNGAYK